MRGRRIWRAGLLAACLAAAACGRAPPTPIATARAPQIAAAPGAAATVGPTLKAVRARGRLICGVEPDLPGFAARDVIGQWRGFDVDICRAVAAAVFDDARQVRIEVIDPKARYSLLQAGKVDVVARGDWTFKDDAGLGINFATVSFFSAPSFLVPRTYRVRNIDGLAGVRVCVQAGASSTLDLNEYFQDLPASRRPIYQSFDTFDDALAAYDAGKCQALSGDLVRLSAMRGRLRDPDRHTVVSGNLHIEPQGPAVRQDDGQWADIVGGAVHAMVLAEDLGVGSRTVAAEREKPSRPEVQRLLTGDGFGQMLMLRDDWAFQVIRQVGSYDEAFARNLGGDTPLKMERGQNALWSAKNPGLLYAPPMR